MPGKRRSQFPRPTQIVLALVFVATLVYLGIRQREGNGRPAGGSADFAAETGSPAAKATVVRNVTLRDRSGKIVYRGDIDLTRSIARINSGKKLAEFRNDGAVFQNRERRLPRKPAGHYREWVHPTPELLPSPGPQRIVSGKDREYYYTPDHYESFQRLKLETPANHE